MADDLTLNTGSGGETLATDEDASNRHYQIIKIADGTADSTTEVQAGHGVAANALRVELPTDGTGQVKLAASAGTSIGSIVLLAGTAEIGKLAAGTAAIGTVKSQGGIAHDAAYSENPLPIGAIAYETDGTVPGTAVAEADITRLKADRDGRLLVNAAHPYLFSASVDYGAAAQTNATIQAAVAAVSIYITDITYSNGPTAVNNVTLLDGSGGTIMHEVYLAVNNTVHIALNTPIRLTANTLLALTSTGTTELACNISGYYAV